MDTMEEECPTLPCLIFSKFDFETMVKLDLSSFSFARVHDTDTTISRFVIHERYKTNTLGYTRYDFKHAEKRNLSFDPARKYQIRKHNSFKPISVSVRVKLDPG